MPVLKNIRSDAEWTQWGLEDYHTYSMYGDPENKPIGLHFKCPGCGSVIGIEIGLPGEHPKWEIDFATLTASPSILHDRTKGGCGWHGYLKNGSLDGKVE